MQDTQAEATLKAPGEQLRLALVYGEAFNNLPQDLYIPPDALEVFLGVHSPWWYGCGGRSVGHFYGHFYCFFLRVDLPFGSFDADDVCYVFLGVDVCGICA